KLKVVAPGVVRFWSTETLLEALFATARSGRPSPLKSPTPTSKGLDAVVKSCLAAKLGMVAPGVVVLRNTERVLEPPLELPFAAARSGKPSPLKSPITTPTGPAAVANSFLAAKLGVAAPRAVVLSKTETVS